MDTFLWQSASHPNRLSAVQPKSFPEFQSKSSIIGGVLCILFTHTHRLIPYCTTLARLLLANEFFCLFLVSCGAVVALNRPTVCALLYTVMLWWLFRYDSTLCTFAIRCVIVDVADVDCRLLESRTAQHTYVCNSNECNFAKMHFTQCLCFVNAKCIGRPWYHKMRKMHFFPWNISFWKTLFWILWKLQRQRHQTSFARKIFHIVAGSHETSRVKERNFLVKVRPREHNHTFIVATSFHDENAGKNVWISQDNDRILGNNSGLFPYFNTMSRFRHEYSHFYQGCIEEGMDVSLHLWISKSSDNGTQMKKSWPAFQLHNRGIHNRTKAAMGVLSASSLRLFSILRRRNRSGRATKWLKRFIRCASQREPEDYVNFILLSFSCSYLWLVATRVAWVWRWRLFLIFFRQFLAFCFTRLFGQICRFVQLFHFPPKSHVPGAGTEYKEKNLSILLEK